MLAEKNLPEGAVVITPSQGQGRGQRGTVWTSEPGKNLTLSILLKPAFLRPDEQFNLSKALALGVVEFVIGCLSPFDGSKGEDARIKWPNDIYIGKRKVAGILIENTVNGNSLSHSIVGIGMNVNQEEFPDELPNPTSLKQAAGKEFDLESCFEVLCSAIERRYLQLRNQPKEIDSDYLKVLYRMGEWTGYIYKGESIHAKINGVSKTGKLFLEKDDKIVLECDIKELEFVL